MFKSFFLSELKYALKQPMIYLFFGIITLLTFAAVVSDNVTIGGAVGNVYRNAPSVITNYCFVLSIFGLLMATAFFNNAALRDHNYNFNEIIYSTPLKKSGYFFGHFVASLLLSTIPILGVFIGVLLGTALGPAFGWIDADRFGSFYIETFINNYLLIILPNMFIIGSIIYAIAHKAKSTVISFVGTMIILMAYSISGVFISDIDNETLGALTDIFGGRAYSIETKYYTSMEQNTISPGFMGIFFINRLVWISAGVIVLLLSYLGFSFKEKHRNKIIKKKKKANNNEKIILNLPATKLSYGLKGNWLQFVTFFKMNFLSITKSITFKILFIFSAILLFSNLIGAYEYYGLQTYPVTYKIIDTISGASSLFIIIILVFFSGELVWRDRENNINEVVDSSPHQSFISLLAKSLSLVCVTTILYFVFVLFGISYQLINGFLRIEIGLYVKEFFLSSLPIYFIWSAIMIFIQVLLNNKYVSYFISILVIFASSLIMSLLKIESNMLFIGMVSSYKYSDMNGFGPAINGTIWFSVYWLMFAVVCLLLSGVIWSRGVTPSLKEKLHLLISQSSKGYRFAIIGFTACWILVAGFVYYNTMVLNTYYTSDESEQLQADFEKKYKKFEGRACPKIHDVEYFIDLYPHERSLEAKALMTLVNESDELIDSIHYLVDDQWNHKISIPNAKLVLNDTIFNYQIYKIEPALQKGDSVHVKITAEYKPKGFENEVSNLKVVKNGTFINNMDLLPRLGYQADFELSDKNTRKKYALAPKKHMPVLDSCKTHNLMANYLTNGISDFIDVKTTISTSSDQIAIAPGSLQKKWVKNGRNYYHYKVDHPSQNFYSFMSGQYQVKTRKWNEIDIEVYFDEKHHQNVDRMMDAVEHSLIYYTSNFGPYMHKQCRVIEFPRYNSFAQAFPGTMPYSESIGFVTNLEGEEDNNVVDAVIAHEMAHQWWAHQLIGAHMQGSIMLSESFSEYSSLMTMKSINNDPMKMRNFLKYNHDRYLRGRSNEREKESPLYTAENQGYIYYAKGSLVMYALQDYIGEDVVNSVMSDFIKAHAYRKPPYPTSLDFMKRLEPFIPDSLKYIEEDWFKTITMYDNRLKEATYKKLDNGKVLASMRIESNKILCDSLGGESPLQLNDWIDIGAFADADEKELIFEKRVKFDKKDMVVTFELDTIPAKLAIDPRRLLIDRIYKDNIKTTKELNSSYNVES